jgi:GNAT superfamily N-acetyltransferase
MTIIRHEFTDEDGTYIWLMSDDGSGHCRVSKENGVAYLDFLSVSKSHRKKGIGRKLQEIREAIIQSEWGMNEAYLWVEKGSWMMGWYERRGYVYVDENEHTPNTVWMKKILQ